MKQFLIILEMKKQSCKQNVRKINMSKRQDRRAKRLAEQMACEEAIRMAPILCVDCSYKSDRPYWHDKPDCAGARLPQERKAPPPSKKPISIRPRLKGWKHQLSNEVI